MSNSNVPNPPSPFFLNFYDPNTSKEVKLSPRSSTERANPAFPQSAFHIPQSTSLNPLNLFQSPAAPRPNQFPSVSPSFSQPSPCDQSFPSPNPNRNFEQDIKNTHSFVQSVEANNKITEENIKRLDNELLLLDNLLESSNQEIEELDSKKLDLNSTMKHLAGLAESKQKEIKTLQGQVKSLEEQKEANKVVLGPKLRETVDYNSLEAHLEKKIRFSHRKINELKSSQDKELKELRTKYEKEIARTARKTKIEESQISCKEGQIRNHKLKIVFQKLLKTQIEAKVPEPVRPEEVKPEVELNVPEQRESFMRVENFYLVLGVILGIILKYLF